MLEKGINPKTKTKGTTDFFVCFVSLLFVCLQAKKALENALLLDPECTEALLSMATMHITSDEYKEAIEL